MIRIRKAALGVAGCALRTGSSRPSGCDPGSPNVESIEPSDVWVNSREPSGVIESSERTVIDQVVDRLAKKYPSVPGEKVADVVYDCYARFDGRPIRDYVPLFVERGARDHLARLGL